ncbi:MAG: Fmu (Sun) domain-containing protein [Ferruginibacter sp.]
MSKFHSYIASASKIISTYSGGKPLAIHIKAFFAADKKFGSKDRRAIASACYCHFRAGLAFKKNTVEEKIIAGLFLCEHKSNELLKSFRSDLDGQVGLSISEKMALSNIGPTAIFPFSDELGGDIDAAAFSLSFLQQPGIYLRIRPGRKKTVLDKLKAASTAHELISDECILLENNIAADKILMIDKEVVVQDLNSQKVLDQLEKEPAFLTATLKIASWDCCAASGGKSILLFDRLKGKVQLTVSDIRENILLNLRTRLGRAGININRSFVTDLSVPSQLPEAEKFSIIICDAPCTGSGTWSRTPEQLYFFDKKLIADYAGRQKNIVSNSIPYLNKGGLFFYITCSVFKKENEEVTAFIQEKFHLQLVQMEYLKGYEHAADTMFVAVFRNI